MHLRGAGRAAARRVDVEGGVEHRVVHPDRRRVVLPQPHRVVQRRGRSVGGELQVLEAAVRTRAAVGPRLLDGLRAEPRERVLGEPAERVQVRLEVGLADQGGPVAVPLEQRGDRRGVDRQRNAVHPHAVRGRVLAGQDRGPGRHADHRLRNCPLVPDASGGQAVGDRGARDRAAVAAQRVVSLLVGGDEEDLASHYASSAAAGAGSVSSCLRSSCSAFPQAPPMTRAIVSGSHRVSYRTRLRPAPARGDLDRAEVILEQRRGDPVLEDPADRIVGHDLLGHGQSAGGSDHPAGPVDLRCHYPGEPGADRRRVADRPPDVLRGAGDHYLAADQRHPLPS